MPGYETEYLNTDREADLLGGVLCLLDPDTDHSTADMIVCELIDLGLCDPERGPRAQAVWQSLDDDLDDEDIRKQIINAYTGGEDTD